MSRKERSAPKKRTPSSKKRKTDARILRTHQRLGRALVELIREKPMDDITVQQVLDRAQVGRSTFYLHYRDKDDLLLSQFEQFLGVMSNVLIDRKEKSLRVMPVEEMFAHIAEQKSLYLALADSGRLNDFFELAPGFFARGIAQRLTELKRVPDSTERELAARSFALAGSLLSLLQWWLNRGAKERPAEMDKLFHRIVWSGLR